MKDPSGGASPAARPTTSRRLIAASVAAAILAACSGGGDASEDAAPTASPGAVTAESTPNAAPDAAPDAAAEPLYSEADMAYLEDMILHHEQALELAALVPARTEREELLRYAEDVEAVQSAEIELMYQFLDEAMAERGGAKVHADHGDHGAGMLTDDEIVAMASTSGEEFERQFLEGMIRHHQGALEMAEEQMASDSRSLGLAELAQHIVEDQTYEIGLMLSWLREWGLSEDGGEDGATAAASEDTGR